MTTIKLEVRKAADDTWSWRRRVNGRITAHGADYNTKAGAVRGLVDDMLTTILYGAQMAAVIVAPESQERMRKTLRKQIEVVE